MTASYHKRLRENDRLRRADSDMRYLGRAWRIGYSGPRENAQSGGFWRRIFGDDRIYFHINEERADALYMRWLDLFMSDAFSATLLKLHYRDDMPVMDSELDEALHAFSGH